MRLSLGQVRALAKANGNQNIIERALREDITGELCCVYPEGTKVYRRREGKKTYFLLYGYGNRDVERTLERLKTLPLGKKPKIQKMWRLFVNGQSHWSGNWASCQKERRSIRSSGSKAPITITRVE